MDSGLPGGSRIVKPAPGNPTARVVGFGGVALPIMVSIYHRQRIQDAGPRQKRYGVGGRLRIPAGILPAAGFGALLLLAGCDPVQIMQSSDTAVSVRYDGVMNGLDQAKALASKACAAYGKTAKMRKVYYEGLGAGERFAFFNCV